MAKILSVNISEKKGTIKHPVPKIILNETGITGDAHAGNWHRQVSLLGMESIQKCEIDAGRKINFGEFAENITTAGIILYETRPFDRFVIGDVELEVTQIGKECHGDSCAIFREVGNCVMPKEGVFCRVVKPGKIEPGDEMKYFPRTFKAEVITLSDRASKGEYEDRSGPRVTALLEACFEEIKWSVDVKNKVIPDDAGPLKDILTRLRDAGTDLVFTTGGTGIGPRDITPEVVSSMLDKEIPGIMELIRVKYGMEKPGALLSRGVAGVMGETLVFALPGSVKAVNEYMSEITKHIRHLIYMLNGIDKH